MRAKYASFLRDNGAVDHLLANLFRLMPENPVIQLHESLTSASPSQKLSSVMSMFSRSPSLQAAGNFFVGQKIVMCKWNSVLVWLVKYVTNSNCPYRFQSLVFSGLFALKCFVFAGNNSSSELAHLACAVYHRALQDLPAIVRQWWNAQDKRVAAVVEKCVDPECF